jgi:hypothetical protein
VIGAADRASDPSQPVPKTSTRRRRADFEKATIFRQFKAIKGPGCCINGAPINADHDTCTAAAPASRALATVP